MAAGLVDWSPDEPTGPVEIRHRLVRAAICAGITATKRCMLHARAATVLSELESWEHRVAALDRPDENLAAQLEHLAAQEGAGAGRPGQPAAGRPDRHRRLTGGQAAGRSG